MMSFVTRLTFAWKVWSGDETKKCGAQKDYGHYRFGVLLVDVHSDVSTKRHIVSA